ncbi:DUF6907 domain-containing protein [Microbacterium sp.]|uniref:DUF6907 domain-containing protein n=1 Tax=Microbacterium sp. TaxID=51671 RepID=UPI00391AAE91
MSDNSDVDVTPCPPWCEQVQCQEMEPADRCHQRMAVVPVVFRDPDGMAAATELVVVTFTSATARDEVWVALNLGEGLSNITLSAESAVRHRRRLVQVLQAAERE